MFSYEKLEECIKTLKETMIINKDIEYKITEFKDELGTLSINHFITEHEDKNSDCMSVQYSCDVDDKYYVISVDSWWDRITHTYNITDEILDNAITVANKFNENKK